MTTEDAQRISQYILDRQGYLVIRSNSPKSVGFIAEPFCSSAGVKLGAQVVVIEEATRNDFDAQSLIAQEIIGEGYRPPRVRPHCYFYRTIAE